MNNPLRKKVLSLVSAAGSVALALSMATPAFAITPEAGYRQTVNV
jgi:hypothetical protein